MASQSSVFSNASTVPLDLIDEQDDDFVNEIEEVDRIFFGNVEINEINEHDFNTNDDDDTDNDESDKENTEPCPIAFSDLDINESVKEKQFLENTCKCEKLYNKVPCSTIVNHEVLSEYRYSCLEMDKNELDMVIKVQLFAHRHNDTNVDAKKHKSKERERINQQYYFNGHQICRKTFLFAHAIGKSQLDSISKSLEKEGLKPRTHGNSGKTPKHALSITDIQRVKHFLQEYAVKFGVPLPGRLPNHKDLKVTLLPSDKTKADIHQIYQEAASSLNYRAISLSEFKKLWLEQCPQIVLMKPATDLCSACQSFTVSLSNTGNMTEEEKTILLQNYGGHVEKVKKQRDYYRDQCQESKENYTQLPDNQRNRGQPPLSFEGSMHYSFDYAQQIHYPHYAQQVGPLFFKTPRKCQCFGVCAEGPGSQIFYLVDESEETGKGANSVISMLHHHFEYKSYGETTVKLHMDNCTGQT
ncbi:uncharacterized protein LOC134714592 isoform X1 [Mytilus trossulus]|uniref:uncharacterized protein LOC134714592 isoform X1 n=1 Tax=Mytilus trossulus TaxID=6551 RepID=UPI0030069A3E